MIRTVRASALLRLQQHQRPVLGFVARFVSRFRTESQFQNLFPTPQHVVVAKSKRTREGTSIPLELDCKDCVDVWQMGWPHLTLDAFQTRQDSKVTLAVRRTKETLGAELSSNK